RGGGGGGRAASAAPPVARRPPPLGGREGAGRPAVWGRAYHRAGADLLAGRGGPVLLLGQGGPVHRAGCHRALPRAAKARPGGCLSRGRRCCAGRCMRPARPTAARRLPTTATTSR